MKDRVLLLALRIASVLEEFSDSEIQGAVRLLEEQGSDSSLLAYIRNRKQSSPARRRTRKAKPIEEQRSKAVIELEQKDPEKYQVLSEFDSLLRKGSVLPAVDDIRKFGESLSKNFSGGSSRRELISKLMALLVDRPMDELRGLLKATLSTGTIDKDDDDYQRLAQFIISGKLSHTSSEQTTQSLSF
jgi:hypothetical protein